MDKKRLPKSLRKFIRREKSRIRRGVLNLKEQGKRIQELYPVKKLIPQNKGKISKNTEKENKSL
jgi:hypothetical protein